MRYTKIDLFLTIVAANTIYWVLSVPASVRRMSPPVAGRCAFSKDANEKGLIYLDLLKCTLYPRFDIGSLLRHHLVGLRTEGGARLLDRLHGRLVHLCYGRLILPIVIEQRTLVSAPIRELATVRRHAEELVARFGYEVRQDR